MRLGLSVLLGVSASAVSHQLRGLRALRLVKAVATAK
jgi:predicted transcriptional regulator